MPYDRNAREVANRIEGVLASNRLPITASEVKKTDEHTVELKFRGRVPEKLQEDFSRATGATQVNIITTGNTSSVELKGVMNGQQ